MASSIVLRSETRTESVSPSPASRSFTASIPTASTSASVATLSLIVSIREVRSRSDISTSSSISEMPTGPGVRRVAGRTTRARPSRRPSAIRLSTVRAIGTLITDAGVIGRSGSSSTVRPPSRACAHTLPVQPASERICATRSVTPASERRPRDGTPPLPGLGERADAQEPLDASPGRLDLVRGEQTEQPLREVVVQAVGELIEDAAVLVGQQLTGPAPEDGAQLRLDVEGEAVVDAVPVTVGHRGHVAALAVGVVDDGVEDRHPAQLRGVLVHERHDLVAVVEALEHVAEPVGHVGVAHQGDRLLDRVGLLPQLDHA